MRVNGVERQMRIVEENSKHWPQHKLDEAKNFQRDRDSRKKDGE